MTLEELRLVEQVAIYAEVMFRIHNSTDEESKHWSEPFIHALEIIRREIRLKTTNPITGKCSECGAVDSHTKICSQGRD